MPNVEFFRFADPRGPQRASQDFPEPETNFSGRFFKFVDKTQFKAPLQTQAAEVGLYSAGENIA